MDDELKSFHPAPGALTNQGAHGASTWWHDHLSPGRYERVLSYGVFFIILACASSPLRCMQLGCPLSRPGKARIPRAA
jgi:hypothetical protein